MKTVRFQSFGVFIVLLVAGYFVRNAVIEARAAIRTLDTMSAEAAGTSAVGAVVQQGRVAAVDVAAPIGQSGNNAFTGRIGRWIGSGKSKRFEVVCELTRIDGMSFEEIGTKRTFVLRGFDHKALGFATGVTYVSGRAAVDLTHVAKSSTDSTSDTVIPEWIRAECGDMSALGFVYYEERYVEKGEEITVRGCQKGEFIEPCRDGLDYVTDGSVASMKRDTRDHHTGVVAGGALALFLALGLVGILASRAVVRSSRAKVAS